ncbi:transcriptional regulator, LuxR family [Beutenbergia cavernae DSM 12333]|uniref:Transcriptional regulator, LuxR family n=1 Tax=Beutenbergia cavernae (strain ATCC BAA-8 / DSM 12333 / CCUG 43141 / JCM 11478 / NBRC 16432 / NCIMB 13614 / HKI 0122) TaxID=471853 RepID=C5C4K4_BEUC1|nr:LuxR C-terminal-related transcriptional regulator [Beutenbergia cavernae]ACQ82128.1 transcriptional regulator, LuxR family [Beutenbergia cavernae DSM 12333]
MADADLALLGLDERTGLIYRAILTRNTASPDDLARAHGEPVDVVRDGLERLRSLGLVHGLAREDAYTAVDPRRSLRALADAKEEELLRLRQATQPLARTFDAGMTVSETGGESTIVVRGSDAVAAWFTRLQQEADAEILSFDRPPYALATANPVEPEVLRRGVRWRALYVAESFTHPGAWEDARRQVANGEEARITAELPTKLAVSDRRTAMVLTSLDVDAFEAVITTAPALVEALCALFERYWAGAVDLPAGAGTVPAPRPETGPTSDERAILAMMAAGATDALAARRLGISPRTLRRRTQALFARLGAANRFQAAVAATRRGWI